MPVSDLSYQHYMAKKVDYGRGSESLLTDITNVFEVQDWVYVLTVVQWENIDLKAGKHKVLWEWYSGDKLIKKYDKKFNMLKPPFNLIGRISAAELGAGNHSYSLYIDGVKVHAEEFSVQ
jgi:hypothetical protein